jgi:OmpA-OmpF porin, OOP family
MRISNLHRMVSAAVACVIALGAAGCAHNSGNADAQASGTQARPDIARTARMTDSAIDTDHRRYEQQQLQIKQLNDSGANPVRSYALSKAQCWLDVSFHEYTRNDRSPFPDDAYDQSVKITEYLRSGGAVGAANNPAGQTPLVNDAVRLREDLWTRLGKVKTDSGYQCAEQLTACAEVELVHAGNEFHQQGWNHAKPYVQIAEDKVGAAEAAVVSCRPKPVVAEVPVAVAAAPAPAAQPEKIVLSAHALFHFNRRNSDDLLPSGRAELDALAVRLEQAYSRVDSIQLIGHTDRLGSDSYNETLGQDRANTVAAYLTSKGITAPISTESRAAREPMVSCGQPRSVALTACLQPNRRVEVLIMGVKK